jgi:hypothetical protein
MMKLPSLVAGGTCPSGSSTDFTIPGPNGSRTGAGGRAGRAAAGGATAVSGGMGSASGVWAFAGPAPAITPTNKVTLRRRSIESSSNLESPFSAPIRLKLYRS